MADIIINQMIQIIGGDFFSFLGLYCWEFCFCDAYGQLWHLQDLMSLLTEKGLWLLAQVLFHVWKVRKTKTKTKKYKQDFALIMAK